MAAVLQQLTLACSSPATMSKQFQFKLVLLGKYIFYLHTLCTLRNITLGESAVGKSR